MTNFDLHMSRLRNQWPGAYGEERAKVIYAAFKDVSDMVWADAVTEVLSTSRAIPLIPELERAVDSARRREQDRLRAKASNVHSIRRGSSADEMAAKKAMRECMQTIGKIYGGERELELTTEETARREELKRQLDSIPHAKNEIDQGRKS